MERVRGLSVQLKMVSMPGRLGPGFSGSLQVAAGGIPCIILDRRRVRNGESSFSSPRRALT